jgi:hypothetical protein
MQRLTFVSLAAALTACGGRTLDDEFTNLAGGGGGDTGTSSTDDSATTGDDAIIGSDGSIGDDAVSVDVTPGTDAGTTVDTGPVSSPIRCGMATCDTAKEQCCVQPSGGTLTSSCRPTGTCGDRAIAFSCSASSCPSGQSCCLRISMTGSTATCSSMCGGGGSYRLCNSDGDCRMGERCRGTEIGVRVCVGFGGGG